jgi:hypothetical protein
MKSLCFVEVDVPDFADSSPEVTQTFRFAKPVEYLPSTIDCIPSIVAVAFTPATISLGQNLGERATLTVAFSDHRHVMNGEDYNSGSFWGKWRARYGTRLRGRSIRWIVGLEGQTLEQMETRHFVIESVEGPTPDGVYKIAAKDVLKLADGDRAQAPVLSNGFLVEAINDSVTAATLSPSGIGNSEYPASGYVAIGGEEICAFTRSADVLTLTRGQLGTAAVDHDAQDRVQLVLRYEAEDPADIIADLLENYAGVNGDFIPLSSWQNETGSFLQRVYTATIPEPTSVQKLISELVEQAALAMWWDDLNEVIRLQVLRPVSTAAATFDEENTLESSLKWKEQPGKRISQVWTYYGMRNPLRPVDEADNYRSNAITANLNAEEDYGGAVIKKIYSRWIPAFGRSVATKLNDLLLGRYVDAPRGFNFEVFRYDQDLTPSLGTGYLLGSWTFQDETGARVMAPIQITRLNPLEDRYAIEAEEMLFDEDNLGDLTNRTIIIDSNVNNVNLKEIHDTLYPDVTGTESPPVTVTCIVETGVIVGSTSASLPAFDVGEWPTGITVNLEVSGRIQGRGGNGGNGGVLVTPTIGESGGPALLTTFPINLDYTDGQIWAGAGGGSGYSSTGDGGAGGGGAGQLPGSGGIFSTFDGEDTFQAENGTTTEGGDAYEGGGDGGDPGEYGFPAFSSGKGSFTGLGGSAGPAIMGIDLITITGSPEGDLRGSTVPSIRGARSLSVLGEIFGSSDIAVPLPGNLQAGDLLMMFITCERGETEDHDDTVTLTTPTGWTQRYHVQGSGNCRRAACYYKVATGLEGSSVSVFANQSCDWGAISIAVVDYTGTPESATATGTSVNPNPPSLTPSWGSDENLWIAAAHHLWSDLEESNEVPDLPTNFIGNLSANNLTVGFRMFTGSVLDPGTFTFAGNENYVAATVAVRKA